MVNYILSFCKITGASRIFKRNFYLPLLKPQTPKEALRTFRITGKWLLGAKIQHYIPVLLNHRKKKAKKSKTYGKKQHEEMVDFTYMSPILDRENDTQKRLIDILESKDGKGLFVYTVEDKKYNIVLQAQFELAVRDGDIIDILVSQKNDKIIVKLKDFKKVPMELQYYEGEDKLYCGEGATSAEEEKFHHHGKYTMSLAKVFEDKERAEEEWEEHLKKLMKRRRKQKGEGSKAWKEMMKETMKNLNWKKFEEDAKKVIDEIAEPATEDNIEMEIDDLDKTKNVNEIITKSGGEMLNQLPTLTEIPEIIKSMDNATLFELEEGDSTDENNAGVNQKRRVSGVKVTLSSGKECFVSGQMVHTDDGDVFVPGQTIDNEYGTEYAPGITINIDNKPTLISGLIMGEEERAPMFLPTQSTITADGQLTFASTSEERPKVEPEKRKKEKRKNFIQNEIIEEETEGIELLLVDESLLNEIELNDNNDVSISLSEASDISVDEKSINDNSSVELNNSELEELDIEAIRLKQEQQRLEIEKLKQILMDDGMDDIIASLEEKKAKLKQKLEELRKLSMVNENNLVTYASDNDALEIASKICENKETINRLVDILLTITRRASTFRDKNRINADNINHAYIILENMNEFDEKFNKCSNKLKMLLKTATVAANEVFKNRPKDQLLALNAISEILVDVLKKDCTILAELVGLMKTPLERSEICNTVLKQLAHNITKSKTSILQEIIEHNNLTEYDLLDKLSKVMDKENDIISLAFSKIIKVDSKVMETLIQNIKQQSKKITNEEIANEILEASIVNTVKVVSEINLNKFMEESRKDVKIEFIEEALSFAQALDLQNVTDNLSNILDKQTINLQRCEKPTVELLKRMTLMRQLAERDYCLKSAINRIKKNPERAKNDPRIRQLIKESAVLISNGSPIRNSRDIPLPLMKQQNLLAIEDFLVQKSKMDCPVLISRGNLQAVIPKESARSVLAGRIPYVLIDESGVTNFKPMHMLSAIKVNQNREKRYEDYLNINNNRDRSSEREEDRTYRQAKSNGFDGSWDSSRRGSGRTMSSGSLYRGLAGPRA